jgi:hypothetical protein
VSDFQLILLEGIDRPVREPAPPGSFSLIPFQMVQEADLKPETIAAWWTPMDALLYASECVGAKGAANALWQLLVAGMIDAVASSSSLTRDHSTPSTTDGHSVIPKVRWQQFTEKGSDFWNAGYARFWFSGHHGGVTYLAFGIKLNPDDVRNNLPPPRPKPKQPEPKQELTTENVLTNAELQAYGYRSAAPVAQAEPVQEKGPPVSKAHLESWYAVYRLAYQGALDTEETAVKSARGMFPGKSVSRESIRTLRGTQKRGRKPAESAK